MKSFAYAGLACLCFALAWPATGSESSDIEFGRAAKLMENGDYANAIPILQDVIKSTPDDPDALWNLGIASAAVGANEIALGAWTRYNKVQPDDRHGIEKLVQVNQSLGRLQQRDHERDRLIAIRHSLSIEERAKYGAYVRDQFVIGSEHFMVQEYFEPENPTNVRYKFMSIGGDQKVSYFFTLESDESDYQIMLENHQIEPGSRPCSIDWYQGQSHATYALMHSCPSYDEAKVKVVAVVEHHAKPLSSTSRSP